MSYLLYDLLRPLLGAQAAQYWAQIFVVGPVD
jgi:hypothetical protein